MTSVGFGAYPPRLSDAEREHALQVLREGAVQGRVSHDTFERRADVILRAQWQGELQSVLHDLPTRTPRGNRLVEAVMKVSAWPGVLRRAWQAERLPELLLPGRGPFPLTIGRAPGSVLRLNHATVSRRHAQLRVSGRGWSLRDLGSSNGTWVNGCRVTGSVRVSPGDQVRFGQVGFRLLEPQPAPTHASDAERETPPSPPLPRQPPKPAQLPSSPLPPQSAPPPQSAQPLQSAQSAQSAQPPEPSESQEFSESPERSGPQEPPGPPESIGSPETPRPPESDGPPPEAPPKA